MLHTTTVKPSYVTTSHERPPPICDHFLKIPKFSQLRLPYTFRGVSRLSDVARPVYTVNT